MKIKNILEYFISHMESLKLNIYLTLKCSTCHGTMVVSKTPY